MLKTMLKVYADRNIPFLKEALENITELHFFDSADISQEQLRDADALFTRTALKVNQKLLEGTNVKFVATATSGIDHYDTEWLAKAGIDYANALGSNANSVAEYVIYFILQWSLKRHIDLAHKTIGIIGYGCVGSTVAKYAKKLGLNILLNDPPKKDAGFAFPKDCQYHELNSLLENADIITNHVPRDFTSHYKTIDLLNANNLPLIKNDTLFIHASRGKVVDEAVLMELIETKNITAIIDVWADEPLFNIPLADKSLFLSPHVAGHSLEGKVLGTKMVLEAFQKHYQNKISPDYSEINRILSEHTKATDEEFNDLISLYQKIQKSRVFEEDHDFMLSLKSIDKEKAGDLFLDYRQKYPIRREML